MVAFPLFFHPILKNMPKVNLSKYTIKEFEPVYKREVQKLIQQVLKKIGIESDAGQPSQDKDLENIPIIYRGKGRFWICLNNAGKVIGTVAIKNKDKGIAKLKRMFVLPRFHGTGVGQKLLDHAVAFAKKQGFKEINLNTHLLMRRAHHFYAKNGFKKIREGEKYLAYKKKLIH